MDAKAEGPVGALTATNLIHNFGHLPGPLGASGSSGTTESDNSGLSLGAAARTQGESRPESQGREGGGEAPATAESWSQHPSLWKTRGAVRNPPTAGAGDTPALEGTSPSSRAFPGVPNFLLPRTMPSTDLIRSCPHSSPTEKRRVVGGGGGLSRLCRRVPVAARQALPRQLQMLRGHRARLVLSNLGCHQARLERPLSKGALTPCRAQL